MREYEKQLAALAAMSNKYGADPRYVLAGGGNTSFKCMEYLWIKGSGTSLATIKPEDFVVMERELLEQMWTAEYPQEEAAREAAVLEDMMYARIKGETRRPSVETLLHDLFPQQYVLHVHPALVNGITCSQEGKAAMERLFPAAVWVDACKPGYILALECKEKMDAYKAETGKDCDLLFLQNHGIFFAADTVEAVDALAASVMEKLLLILFTPSTFEIASATNLSSETSFILSVSLNSHWLFFCLAKIFVIFTPRCEIEPKSFAPKPTVSFATILRFTSKSFFTFDFQVAFKILSF